MAGYFATCARGLEPILARELLAIGATNIDSGRGGVSFEGEHRIVYRANLELRTAVRVLKPILQAEVFSPDELYEVVRTIDWSTIMTPEQTLAVDCNVKNSFITHSQYASRRVKDAICDQFRDKLGRRPSVNVEQPSIGINLHISRNKAILSLDSSWDSLHKRGYRPIQTRAPLNESLAAGILLHLGYDGSDALVDPMCGSGTFPIEAAWIATKRPPGLTRRWFGFYGWSDFDKGEWADLREDARKAVLPTLAAPILGTDVRQDAIDFANNNAKGAGVGHLISFNRMDLSKSRPPADVKPGLIVCNPPYGERIGDEAELEFVYGSLGEVIAGCWPGWRLAAFTANDFLARQIKLPVRRRTPFFNGSLECKLWEFREKT